MSKKATSGVFGGADYRQGALERLNESQILLRESYFGGCVYLAGRAVEGMLRAVIWTTDIEIQQGKKSLETGHDLRQLLAIVRDLGLLHDGGRDDELEVHVQTVGRLWMNNLRFASARYVETWWWGLGEVHKRRTMKQAATAFFAAASAIIKRCDRLCDR